MTPPTQEELDGLPADKRQELYDAHRQRPWQHVTSIGLLLGLILTGGGLVYTALTWETGQETLRTTQQEQIADRYSKALEQIGSDNVEVRIGGLFALERIAEDSPPYAATIPHVIMGFILGHDRPATAEGRWQPGADVGAALRVLGIIAPFSAADAPHLGAAHFEGAEWKGVDLSGANLFGAHLSGADLTDANLTRVDLTRVDLTRANLARANLSSADLTRADLTSADLASADLDRVDLTDAKLTRADLTRAKLTSAKLTRADLTRAKVTSVDLTPADLANRTEEELPGKETDVVPPEVPEVDLTPADLTRANLTEADLTRAKLTYANLTDADLTRADLTGADLRNVTGITPEEIREIAKTGNGTKF
ncbi:pentapeptide repeat-containing protein [Nonomuraea sp. NPDC052129]|uniref:pentapeptide repeat-containing protein n=1 Tax=Nonomuraea sp. NPDC052129 TaxID=3154651 RepID=UPI00344AE9AF